jgi:RNA polymerase sigma-70 factor (ECF subfamily)
MGRISDSGTGTTLMQLLQEPGNPRAWSAFVDRYGPRIFGWCRRWNLQQADAENVTQEVLVKLYEKLQLYEPAKGGFRAWLKTVTQHAWTDYLRSQARGGLGEGGTAMLNQLHTVAAREDLVKELEEEFDHEVLEAAKTRVQLRVAPNTWQAFVLLAVEGKSGAEAATELGMSVSGVFVARRRVQAMLQEEVRRLQGGTAEQGRGAEEQGSGRAGKRDE